MRELKRLKNLIALHSMNIEYKAPYDIGVYNGLEAALAILENREPKYIKVKEKPDMEQIWRLKGYGK